MESVLIPSDNTVNRNQVIHKKYHHLCLGFVYTDRQHYRFSYRLKMGPMQLYGVAYT